MDGITALHVDKPKRRARLTLADRLADVDESMKYHETKLEQLRQRRHAIMNAEAKRVADAQAALERSGFFAPTHSDEKP